MPSPKSQALGWQEEVKIFQRGGGCPGLVFLKERELSLVAGCGGEEENPKELGTVGLCPLLWGNRKMGKKSSPRGVAGDEKK